jgi:hypothetical protein
LQEGGIATTTQQKEKKKIGQTTDRRNKNSTLSPIKSHVRKKKVAKQTAVDSSRPNTRSRTPSVAVESDRPIVEDDNGEDKTKDTTGIERSTQLNKFKTSYWSRIRVGHSSLADQYIF